MLTDPEHKPRIALVLGSGAARGWSHIGVILELAEMGIRPDVVTGASIGAIVAGGYASGHLETIEEWARSMGRMDIIRLLDAKIVGGGFLQGSLLMNAIKDRIGNPNIEDLEIAFGCVATEFGTGREVWMREGSLLDACRASIALPGMFAPARYHDGRLLLDGGLVNPVPVSLAKAMGASIVIAVNLNGDLVGRRFPASGAETGKRLELTPKEIAGIESKDSVVARWSEHLKAKLGIQLDSYLSSLRGDSISAPGLFDVIVGSINVMQDRITRSRMAGEPPDIHITPRLKHIGLMEFDRAEECIAAGRKATQRHAEELEELVKH